MHARARILSGAHGLLLLAIGVFAGAGSDAPPPAGARLDADPLAGIDRSVRPGDDFDAFANGEWLKSTEIPPDRSSASVARDLSELTERRIMDLIGELAASDAPAGSNERKIADYYSSFMDEAGIEARGLSVLQPQLRRIAAIRDRRGLAQYLGSTLRADVDVLNATSLYTDNVLGVWIAQDLDDPTRYAAFLLQGGLGMPDRDYYLSDAKSMPQVRAQYQQHIAADLRLAGIADAPARADDVYRLERRLAEAHSTRAEAEDVQRGHNHWSRAELRRRAPGLDWDALLAAAGLGHRSDLVVWQPGAVTALARLAASEPLSTWRAYLQFHAVTHHARYLPKAFTDESFAFYGRVLQGTLQQRERWRRAVSDTDAALGQAVGQRYVARYFPASSKTGIEQMVRNLTSAFAARIDALDWMSPQTKLEAKAKLASLRIGIGYPDRWRDYSRLAVRRGDAFGNAERAELFELRRSLDKLGRPVDRSEWVTIPQRVNAFNLPAMNALNFPAAILQPPYFDPARPAAMNYGAIGATIGHEISHSFDDQGAQFDAHGRLHNWWTAEDLAHFKASSRQLVAQFDQYRPLPDLAINGEQTLSENIADVAGLGAAYDAYRLAAAGGATASIDGFSDDQLFFLSYAQTWRAKYREPLLRQIVVADGHSPDAYRADTVRNLDAWYAAFDVQPGESLYLPPEQRARIW